MAKGAWRRGVAAAVALGMLSDCAAIRLDLRHSGGYAGHLMDRHFVDASSSKKVQLLRAAMVIAIVSRMGVATVHDGREADAFVDYLTNATRELNTLAGHVYPVTRPGAAAPDPSAPASPSVPCGPGEIVPPSGGAAAPGRVCDDYTALFEADLPRLEYMIYRLVSAALPQREAAAFVRAATHGNVLMAALRALRLASSVADAGHRGAAAYRSAMEVLGAAVRTSGTCATPVYTMRRHGSSRVFTPGEDTTELAMQCLGMSDDSLTHNPARDDVRFPVDVDQSVFRPLFALAQTSCRMLPNTSLDEWVGKPGTPEADRLARCGTIFFAPRQRYDGITAMISFAPKPPPAGAADAAPTVRPQ